MEKQFLLLLFLSFHFVVCSQKADGQKISYDTDYLLEEFRLPGGIPGNNVNCIAEGPHGFLWFGTHAGLVRYDGYEFVTYGPVEGDTLGETTSLVFPYVENLYWDHFKKLWVTTYGGGLFRFDPETETFKHFKANPGDPTAIPHDRVMCAIEDARGELWFGTAKGLSRFDRKTEKFTSYFANPTDPKSLRHDQVHHLYVDKQGVLWIATGQVLWNPEPGGLSRYHPETNSFSNYGYSGSEPYLGAVRPMLEDSLGNFWIGNTDGLFKMDRQAGTFEKMPFDPPALHPPGSMDMEKVTVHAIYEDREGNLWVGTIGASNYASHLSRFDPEAKTTEYFRIPTSCWQVLESSDGTVWAAGAGVGGKAWKLKPKTLEFNLQRGGDIKAAFPKSQLFKDMKVEPSYILDGPHEMTIDPATGVFWVQYVLIFNSATTRTRPGLPVLASYDPKNDRYAFYSLPGLNSDFADRTLLGNLFNPAGMAVDKRGRIWGSYAHEDIGIYSFDPKTGAIQHFTHDPQDANSLSSNFVVSMLMDSRGEIWVATFRAGLNRLNPETGKITHYTQFDIEGKTQGTEYFVAYAFMEDKEGKIWAGGDFSDGVDAFVVIIDPITDSIKEFPLPEALSSTSIHYITQDPAGKWVDFVLFQRGLCTYVVDQDRFSFTNTTNGTLPFDNIASARYDNKGNLWVAARQTNDFVFWPANAGSASEKYLFKNSTNLSSRSRQVVVDPSNGHLYFLNDEGWAEIDPENISVESPANSSITTLLDLYVQGKKQVPGKGGILSKPLWMLDEITLPNDAETFSFRFTDFNFRNSTPMFQYRLYPYETEWRKTNQEPTANYYKIPHGKYRFQVRSIQVVSGQLSEQQAELKVTILPPWWKSWWAYTIYGLLFFTGIYFFDRYERRRIIQRERRRILEKEAAQKREIEKAYADLKAAQAQLIQSEKLASLGELTAGIAHEIQNPLNFVNNFSELSVDLIKEIQEERQKKKEERDEVLENELLDDLASNQQKINHHGKRAASIVTGMLLHARTSSGTKEPTDLNALADEYLRLSYHGLRAKDSTFNAKMITDFDPSIGKVEVIPQDIGRVFLNIINNAFYATQQRRQLGIGELEIGNSGVQYEPTVSISSRLIIPPSGGQRGAVFKIKDNGTGIPDDVKAKIFQPFFTTKPTGQGTGLGLSLSYDIVVKGHGGNLKVESADGQGTEFIIHLPTSN